MSSPAMNEIFHQASDPLGRFTVIFEDDGRVAYGYLLDAGSICADAWLYNVQDCPEQPEWHDPSNAPFLNPCSFAQPMDFERPSATSDIVFVWDTSDPEGSSAVNISIRGRLIGRLAPGTKPGWARLAAKDGPLALTLPPKRN